jgi:hypothetical protein
VLTAVRELQSARGALPTKKPVPEKAPGAKSRDLLLLDLKQREDVVADCVTLLEGGIRFLIARW